MKISISIFAVVLLLSLLLLWSMDALMLIIAIALHEAGHIIAARARKISISSFSFDILGARLDIDGSAWSGLDITMICLCGPLANILTSLLAIMIFPPCELRDAFVFASIALCALNMLPIESFDGYRIACAILERYLCSRGVRVAMRALSFVCIFTIWTFSLYILLKVGSSLSLFIFSASLFSKIFVNDR